MSPQFHCTCDDYFETPRLEGDVNSHWQTLAQIKDDEHDLSHPEFDALNGEKLPEHEPKSTLFPKFAKDSDEPEGEIDIPHEVPELASSDDEDSSSESDESDDDSDDDDEQFWGMSSRMLSRAPTAPQHPSDQNRTP